MPKMLSDYLDELTARGDERAVYAMVHAPEGANHISPAAKAAVGTHFYVVPATLDNEGAAFAIAGELAKRFSPNGLGGLKVYWVDWASKMLFASATLTNSTCVKQRRLRAQAIHMGQTDPLPARGIQALMTLAQETAQ